MKTIFILSMRLKGNWAGDHKGLSVGFCPEVYICQLSPCYSLRPADLCLGTCVCVRVSVCLCFHQTTQSLEEL